MPPSIHSKKRIATTMLALGLAAGTLVACTKKSTPSTTAEATVASALLTESSVPLSEAEAVASDSAPGIAPELPSATPASPDATAPAAVSAVDSVAPSVDAPPPPPPISDEARAKLPDVLATVAATNQFPTFIKLVTDAGLANELSTGGPFTIVVPTEDAFAAIPPEFLKTLTDDKAKLTKVLKYHVAGILISADALGAGGEIPTLEGSTINVTLTDKRAYVNKGLILGNLVDAKNGAFFPLNQVQLPPDL